MLLQNIIRTSARDGLCTLYDSFLLVVSLYLCIFRRFYSYNYYYIQTGVQYNMISDNET